LLFASLQELGCCIGVVGAHFSVLKLVFCKVVCCCVCVCVCVFVGGASGGGFVVDSEIEMREV
jgi:hypothetical protein